MSSPANLSEDSAMANPPITSREFGRRFRKALSVPFLLNQVCSSNIQEFVTEYASSLGCTEKSFFFPLLTCAAACLGTEATVQLTAHWSEPPLLWTLVISPRSLQRIDVAEHLKQQILCAQNRALVLGKDEDTKEYLKKFLFDEFTLDKLQDTLKLSNGHGLAIYNSVRGLNPNLATPDQADILLRLNSGLSWFTDSRVNRMTLTKTRVNFTISSTPFAVHQTLAVTPNFQELFHQCFLTTCSEENHVKFAQISDAGDSEKLTEIFVQLLKLHSRPTEPIVYRLGEEAKEKFAQIHDELTDKAKQMARKSAHKVFQPALSYLVRLSCVLHVLDSVIDAINYKVPISRLTWSTEISAATVWQARELLGHIIEQRHALMEPTGFENSATKQPATVQIVNQLQRTPQMQPHSPRIAVTPPSQQNITSPGPSFSFNARRNILNTGNRSVINNRTRIVPQVNGTAPTPIISSVHSAGLPVMDTGLNLPPTLSVSVSADEDVAVPALLSRTPYVSVLDISEEDFLSGHRSSIRRLFKHSASEVTPSRCVQLKLTPDPTASEETLRHTQAFARSFLKRLEKLGFGLCDGPKNGNLRNFVFKKKKFSALGDEQKQILTDIKVSEVEYNKCFTTAVTKEQNGGIVCLE